MGGRSKLEGGDDDKSNDGGRSTGKSEEPVMTKKKPKRLIYCERCNHPEDRVGEEGQCTAKTVKTGARQCRCPKFVSPTGGAMASLTQRLTMEKARAGELPPPVEVDNRPPRR